MGTVQATTAQAGGLPKKCPRKSCKVSLKDRTDNETIGAMLQGSQYNVMHRRLRWLGHLAEMPDDRLPKTMLFSHMDGSDLRGRAQKQWVDYVREVLHITGLSHNWWRGSQDMAVWRAAMKGLPQRN